MVELRQQRLVVAALLKQLGIPEDPLADRADVGARARSVKARAAANTRWQRGSV